VTNALYIAALLIFLTGLAHSVLGERYILTRLFRRDNLPVLFGSTTFTIQTLRFAWHITTVTWWGIAVMLLQVASGHSTVINLTKTIGGTLIICGVLPLIMTRGKHLSWIVFLAAGALVLHWTP
jgi:hypothetical protein